MKGLAGDCPRAQLMLSAVLKCVIMLQHWECLFCVDSSLVYQSAEALLLHHSVSLQLLLLDCDHTDTAGRLCVCVCVRCVPGKPVPV